MIGIIVLVIWATSGYTVVLWLSKYHHVTILCTFQLSFVETGLMAKQLEPAIACHMAIWRLHIPRMALRYPT